MQTVGEVIDVFSALVENPKSELVTRSAMVWEKQYLDSWVP
jgi:hypothetical protein